MGSWKHIPACGGADGMTVAGRGGGKRVWLGWQPKVGSRMTVFGGGGGILLLLVLLLLLERESPPAPEE